MPKSQSKPNPSRDEDFRNQTEVQDNSTLSEMRFKALVNLTQDFIAENEDVCNRHPRVWRQQWWRETCAEFVAKYAEEMWEYPRENVRDRDADGAAAAEDRDGGQVHGGDEPPNGTDGAAPATEDVNGPDFVKPGKKNARGKKKAGDEMVDYDAALIYPRDADTITFVASQLLKQQCQRYFSNAATKKRQIHAGIDPDASDSSNSNPTPSATTAATTTTPKRGRTAKPSKRRGRRVPIHAFGGAPNGPETEEAPPMALKPKSQISTAKTKKVKRDNGGSERMVEYSPVYSSDEENAAKLPFDSVRMAAPVPKDTYIPRRGIRQPWVKDETLEFTIPGRTHEGRETVTPWPRKRRKDAKDMIEAAKRAEEAARARAESGEANRGGSYFDLGEYEEVDAVVGGEPGGSDGGNDDGELTPRSFKRSSSSIASPTATATTATSIGTSHASSSSSFRSATHRPVNITLSVSVGSPSSSPSANGSPTITTTTPILLPPDTTTYASLHSLIQSSLPPSQVSAFSRASGMLLERIEKSGKKGELWIRTRGADERTVDHLVRKALGASVENGLKATGEGRVVEGFVKGEGDGADELEVGVMFL